MPRNTQNGRREPPTQMATSKQREDPLHTNMQEQRTNPIPPTIYKLKSVVTQEGNSNPEPARPTHMIFSATKSPQDREETSTNHQTHPASRTKTSTNKSTSLQQNQSHIVQHMEGFQFVWGKKQQGKIHSQPKPTNTDLEEAQKRGVLNHSTSRGVSSYCAIHPTSQHLDHMLQDILLTVHDSGGIFLYSPHRPQHLRDPTNCP
uniref:Uncharacterized protein n=1 Tax=Physcomitrium patens TaxID=3218 RepID=A0A2K1JPI9_PHYPA|nr:hypothetical protein PHYPA_015829 [Physcomitrium patens]